MGDVLRDRVAGADAGDADIRGFAGFAEGVVARVEVFAFLLVERRKGLLVWVVGLVGLVLLGSGCGFDGGWVRLVRARLGTYLELVLEEVFLGGHFAVQAQQTLLLGAHRLRKAC